MQKTWTITIDVQDNPYSSHDDNEQEMAYWEDVIETAVQGVVYSYDKMVDRQADRLDYEAFDFTNVSVTREGQVI